jgi:hypothetical protein
VIALDLDGSGSGLKAEEVSPGTGFAALLRSRLGANSMGDSASGDTARGGGRTGLPFELTREKALLLGGVYGSAKG